MNRTLFIFAIITLLIISGCSVKEGSCKIDADCEEYCYEKGNRGVISYDSFCREGVCECVCSSGMCD